MKELILIFLSTVTILVVGIFFGFEEIKNPYEYNQRWQEISTPLKFELKEDLLLFLEVLSSRKPAL